MKKKESMSKVGVKLETIIHDGCLLVFAATRLNLTCVFPGCTNVYNNDKTMLRHFRSAHTEMPIMLVLPSNNELWKIKPNHDIVPAVTYNNTKIIDFVGLTSEKELREYLGNGTRMTQYGHLDLYDVIAKIYGCSREQARKKVPRTP